MELLLVLIAGMLANRAGARIVRNLPEDSPLKRPGYAIFGGGGGGPKEPV